MPTCAPLGPMALWAKLRPLTLLVLSMNRASFSTPSSNSFMLAWKVQASVVLEPIGLLGLSIISFSMRTLFVLLNVGVLTDCWFAC